MTAKTAEPGRKTATLRGTAYNLRELSIGEYDEAVQKATDTKQNALGEDVETTDRGRLLRFMVLKSSGLTLKELAELPMPVVLKLNQLVNDMHYLDEKSDEEKAEASEGDSTGNG